MNKFIILISLFFLKDDIILFDKNVDTKKWYITNDSVMGGISNSSVSKTKSGSMLFSGEVSTDNNGGFSMTRLPIEINLTGKKSKLIIKLKGDGKNYQFRMKATNNQKYWYVQSFQTKKGNQEIVLNLSDFYPSFRGYKLNLDNFSENKISEIAILIGNNKNQKFALEIEKIYIQ